MFAASAMAREPDRFELCDGYPAPTKHGDSMLSTDQILGLGATAYDYGYFNPAPVNLGTAENCDAALADPRLQAAFWQRRAHLLQAKALSQISGYKTADAITTLDQSDALIAAHPDAYFEASTGLGNRMLRAIALFKLNRLSEARAILDAVSGARPYAQSTQRFVRVVRFTFDPGPNDVVAELNKDLPTQPDVLRIMFWIAMLRADFGTAIRLADRMKLDPVEARGKAWSFELVGDKDQESELITDRAAKDAAVAYAHFAQGDRAGAKANLVKIEADLVAATIPPVVGPSGKVKEQVEESYQRRVAAAAQARHIVSQWTAAMALRDTLATENPAEAVDTILKAGRWSNEPLVDLLRQARPINTPDRAQLDATITALDRAPEAALAKRWRTSYEDISRMLPQPEAARLLPKIGATGDRSFSLNGMGLIVTHEDNSEGVKFSYVTDRIPRAMIEEADFVAASRYVLSHGKDGFVVDYALTIVRKLWDRDGGTTPGGYEAQLRIRPMNASEAAANGEKDRFLAAQDVLTALPNFAPQ
jgi:hypothetical protein